MTMPVSLISPAQAPLRVEQMVAWDWRHSTRLAVSGYVACLLLLAGLRQEHIVSTGAGMRGLQRRHSEVMQNRTGEEAQSEG